MIGERTPKFMFAKSTGARSHMGHCRAKLNNVKVKRTVFNHTSSC